MSCASCGRTNPAIARFCAACGRPLAPRCPACGTENEGDARFCIACGAALATEPAEKAEVRTGHGPVELIDVRWGHVPPARSASPEHL